MLATTPFSLKNIYLALKTSRNNAVVDLSESYTIEKRVIKESILGLQLPEKKEIEDKLGRI